MIDIRNTRYYLKSANIDFNDTDKVSVNGDLGKLEGYIEVYGGKGPKVKFTILARDNGVFVDYEDGYGRDFIKKVQD